MKSIPQQTACNQHLPYLYFMSLPRCTNPRLGYIQVCSKHICAFSFGYDACRSILMSLLLLACGPEYPIYYIGALNESQHVCVCGCTLYDYQLDQSN